jgi:hypothetical protein
MDPNSDTDHDHTSSLHKMEKKFKLATAVKKLPYLLIYGYPKLLLSILSEQ